MKILKYLLYTLLVVFVIYLVTCFMGPKQMKMEKSMKINASPEAIYEEISDFGKWTAWSPWHKMDPNMKSTTIGNPGEVGHKQSWEKFVEVIPNEFIKSEMHFMGEESTPAFSEFKLTPDGDATNVSWSMDGGDTPFLMRGMMMIMNFEKMLGDQFSEGLGNLKKIAEEKPKAEVVSYEVLEMPQQWYVGITHAQIKDGDIKSEMFAKDYEAIGKAIGGIEKATGMPFSVAHNYNDATGTMDLEVALPVAAEMKVGEGLACSSIPAGKSAKYIYTGPYEGSSMAWGKFMTEVMKKHKPRWDAYEVYANDPATVSGPDQYITWLIQPVE